MNERLTAYNSNELRDHNGRRVAWLGFQARNGSSMRLEVEDAARNARRLALAWNHHDDMIGMLRRFLAIRKPNMPNTGPWTKAETERSLAALENKARALLARIEGE